MGPPNIWEFWVYSLLDTSLWWAFFIYMRLKLACIASLNFVFLCFPELPDQGGGEAECSKDSINELCF